MLVKCVCNNCGHSYLADDQAGQIACPRCGAGNEGVRNPSDIPDAPRSYDPGGYDAGFGEQGYDPFPEDPGYAAYEEPRFDPQAPPAMYVTSERFLRGLVFGAVATGAFGVVIGASLAALRIALPAALAVTLALAAGCSCRYGFGGRAARRSLRRVVVALALVVVIGTAGFFTGSWVVERYTGNRADVTRRDLDEGIRDLTGQHLRAADEGTKFMLGQQIREVQRLQGMSDAEIEDYLWTQQAQIGQPLLAWTTLRVTEGPAIRLGTDRRPVKLPEHTPAAILAAELILAIWMASRLVMVPGTGGGARKS